MSFRDNRRIGYAFFQANDGTVTFGRATARDRVRSKILFVLLSMTREVPALRLDKGSDVPKFIHEPNDEVLGMQLNVEVSKAVAAQIPEIRLVAVQVNKGEDPNASYINVVYRFTDEIAEEDRLEVPLSMWGVT